MLDIPVPSVFIEGIIENEDGDSPSHQVAELNQLMKIVFGI